MSAVLAVTLAAATTQAADTIVETAKNAGSFKTLTAALQAADLVDALQGEGPFTVLAPTDEAFSRLPKGALETLLKPENKEKLAGILAYHVIVGDVPAAKVTQLSGATTLNGQRVDIRVDGISVVVDNANVIKTDIRCSNGVIHVIDAVLLPPEEEKVSAAEGRNMIEHAVARGVRFFNAGHHAACADIYSEVSRTMLEQSDQMPPLVVSSLKSAMAQAGHEESPTHRAWALRRGLDQAYHALRQPH